MSWTLEYLPEAEKDLKALDGSQRLLVLKAIKKVQQNPLPAEENGYGEEVKKTVMFFVVIGGGVLLFLLTMIAIVQKNRKNKKAKENI